MTWVAVRMLLGAAAQWLGIVLGIFFCTFLITHLLSMVTGMMERSYALITDIPAAQVWVMDPAVQYVDEPIGLPDGALQRVRGVPGVAWATPLITTSLRARIPGGLFRSVMVVGVDDATLIGLPPDIIGGVPGDLRDADAAFLDLISTEELPRVSHGLAGRSRADRPLAVGDELFVNDHRIVIRGFARLGPRFLAKPVLYMPYARALQISPPVRNMLSYVLAAPAPGEDAVALARRIESLTNLRARTSAEFADDTYWYYVWMTGVVTRIFFMVGIGAFVGIAVSALLLYIFTTENARYYITFKALGATDAAVARMVLVQAALCGVTGYGLGVGVSAFIGRNFASDAMPYKLVPGTMAFAGCAVLLVCTASSFVSVRRVLRLEPALAFK